MRVARKKSSKPDEAELARRAEELLAEARVEDIARASRRVDMMQRIATMRWEIARKHHRDEDGNPLDFGEYPFQPAIYQDTAPEQVMMCSTQIGKSVWLLTTAVAMALAGLKVFYVFSKFQKRNITVASQIDPIFQQVDLYRKAMQGAREKAGDADNVSLKFFGHGFINFVASNSPSEFTGYRADVAVIDDHQDCEIDNLSGINGRLAGSKWRFRIWVGNPRGMGSAENENIHWQYLLSDQRQWHIPCYYCGKEQILGWWSHFVDERKNKFGGIVSVSPRDPDWRSDRAADMRPICTHCHKPMNRLARDGRWIAMKPGVERHGYQLSNLYNPNTPAAELFEQYVQAKHSPVRMQRFINDQLGLPHNFDGDSITDEMLENASTGNLCNLPSYRFERVGDLLVAV